MKSVACRQPLGRSPALRALAIAAAVLATPFAAAPAAAQVADDVIIEILRQCARIDDPSARLACFDNNIRSAGAPVRNTVPGRVILPQSSGGAPIQNEGATGFGREDVRAPSRSFSAEADEIRARVTDVTERQPGVYLVALEDGAEWLFTETMAFSYRPPRPGDTVTISRAALGSFLLRFDSQQGVRVRRVQ